MTICIDARTMGYRPSGVGMYLFEFAKELIGYDDIELVLITDVCSSVQMEYFKDKVNTKLCIWDQKVKKGFGVFAYFRYVQRIIEEVRPDFFWEVNNLFPVKLKNPYGKIVLTIHDVFPIYMPEYYGKIYPHYFRYGVKKSIKNTDYIIYNSNETKVQTEKYFREARHKEDFISYIIVDEEITAQKKQQEEEYFLYIGNMEQRKGTDILLKAFYEYVQNGGKKSLHCAGKIREEQINEMLDDISRKTDKIKYLGYIDEEEKKLQLCNCSCFIFPSRAEGFGIPIIEAFLCERPVIASKLSIFEEIAGKEISYVDIEQPNAVFELAQRMKEYDTSETITVNRNAYKEIVARYEPKHLGKQMYDFFKRSLNK